MKVFFASVLSFALLDALWFGLLAGDFFLRQMTPLARVEEGKFALIYWPLALIYLLLGLGLTFLVQPHKELSAVMALGRGALFGAVVYGIYDLTNHATLIKWPVKLLLVDISWGIFSSSVVALVIFFLRARLS